MTKIEGSPRERLLAAANELFYAEGVHTVGIERILERAGVAKASLYTTFGSKEELVAAYLQARADGRRERILRRIAKAGYPAAKILAVFDHLADVVSDPAFRGCAFVNASAEGPRGEGKAAQISAEARTWIRELFTDLARQAGARRPEQLGRQLALLYDGATVSVAIDGDPAVAADARAAADELLRSA